MNAAQTSTPRRLNPGQFLNFRRPRRLCLRATQGTVWITVDGRLEDIVLERGECRVFDGPDRVIATAIGGSAELTVATLAPAPGWRDRLAATFGRYTSAVGA